MLLANRSSRYQAALILGKSDSPQSLSAFVAVPDLLALPKSPVFAAYGRYVSIYLLTVNYHYFLHLSILI